MPKEPSNPRIFNSIVDTIGNTPLIRIKDVFSEFDGQYFGKIETFNPGRSSKDRIAVTMIDEAEEKGLLQPGGTIVEATSGNTGLGLALVAIEKGYKVILVMPDKMSPQKINLVKALGCEVIVCPTEVEPEDPRSYYSVSRRIAEETDGAFYTNQYFNPSNPLAHYKYTGPEIWEQTNGKITHFIAGVGTGGTISGVGQYLKEQNPAIQIIGVDPVGSILAYYHKHRDTETEAHAYKVEGVGEDIIPETVDFDVIDEFVVVNDEESFNFTRRLAREEGILVGGSSGLAAAGAYKYAQTHDTSEMYTVILFPDTGERYLGRIFSDSWLRSNGFLAPPRSILDILNAKPANLPPVIAVDEASPLYLAVEKIRKFRINQIVVVIDDDDPKILRKSELYQALLRGVHKDNPIKSLPLEKLHAINVNSSLTELIFEIIKYGIILIEDKGDWIGILSRQDVIDNMQVEDLSDLSTKM